MVSGLFHLALFLYVKKNFTSQILQFHAGRENKNNLGNSDQFASLGKFFLTLQRKSDIFPKSKLPPYFLLNTTITDISHKHLACFFIAK